MYADDIVLIADTKEKMNALFDTWTEDKMNMEINTNRTSYIKINEKTLTTME